MSRELEQCLALISKGAVWDREIDWGKGVHLQILIKTMIWEEFQGKKVTVSVLLNYYKNDKSYPGTQIYKTYIVYGVLLGFGTGEKFV